MREVLLGLMLGLPAAYQDHEEADVRRERLAIVAQAISDATARASCSGAAADSNCQKLWSGEPLDLAVLLLTEAYFESRLARNVHEGNCREYECDPFRSRHTGKVVHRARTLWQMQYNAPIEDEWYHMVGVDLRSTRKAAWAATKLLSISYRACGSIAGAISRLSGNGRCVWSGAEPRVRLFESLRLRASRVDVVQGEGRSAKAQLRRAAARPTSTR